MTVTKARLTSYNTFDNVNENVTAKEIGQPAQRYRWYIKGNAEWEIL